MLHPGERKDEIQWVRLHPLEVEAVLAISKMPGIAQCIQGLNERVFNEMQFFIRDTNEGVAVSSPSMDQITSRYWNPWARSANGWKLTHGVIPYIPVPYSKIAGKTCVLVDPALGDLSVPKSPYPSEGYIMTGRKAGSGFGPQQYKWVWTTSNQKNVKVQFIHCEDSAPDVITGRLNSLLANLVPEWLFLRQAEHAMLVTENLNQYPGLLLSMPAPTTPVGDGHLRGQLGGPPQEVPPDRAFHSVGAVRIDDERWMREQYQNQKFYEAIAEAATKVCISTWGGDKSSIHKEADVAFERQLERRFVLPRGAKLEKMPKSEGISRMELQQLTREFEDHGAALIAISSGARAPHGKINTKDGAAYDEGFRRAVIVSRKRQFRAILSSVFAVCNWRLFAEELFGEGVSTRQINHMEWISAWAADKVDVYLGPFDEEAFDTIETPEQIQRKLMQHGKREREKGPEDDQEEEEDSEPENNRGAPGDREEEKEPPGKDGDTEGETAQKKKKRRKKQSVRTRMRLGKTKLPHEIELERQIADITQGRVS